MRGRGGQVYGYVRQWVSRWRRDLLELRERGGGGAWRVVVAADFGVLSSNWSKVTDIPEEA